MMRNLKLFYFLSEVQNVQVMLETTKHITKPIMGKFLFVYLVFYTYAQVGKFLLGGVVTYQSFA